MNLNAIAWHLIQEQHRAALEQAGHRRHHRQAAGRPSRPRRAWGRAARRRRSTDVAG